MCKLYKISKSDIEQLSFDFLAYSFLGEYCGQNEPAVRSFEPVSAGKGAIISPGMYQYVLVHASWG